MSMKRARDAYPDKYAAAVARKRARRAAPAVKAEVARQIRTMSDVKFTDVYNNPSNCTSSGVISSATVNLVRGTAGIDNFQGNNIVPKGFTMRYTLSANTQLYSVIRVMCFQWFDASVPTISGILQQTGAQQVTMSSISVTNKDQIRVLVDKCYYMNPQAGDNAGIVGYGGVVDKFYIPGSRLRKLKFNPSTNAVQDGCIYTLFISDDSTATFPTFNFYSRLSFTDV